MCVSKRFSGAVWMFSAFSVALSYASQPAHAEEPEPVWRTFAVLVSGVGDVESELVPDFWDSDSKAVTVLPDAENVGGTFYFKAASGVPDGHPLANDTVWYSQPAHHTAQGPTPSFPFLWLITPATPEPPPVGAHTFTGTDSPFIDAQARYLAKPCEAADVINGECTPSDVSNGYWHFSTHDGEVFVIVTALFSK